MLKYIFISLLLINVSLCEELPEETVGMLEDIYNFGKCVYESKETFISNIKSLITSIKQLQYQQSVININTIGHSVYSIGNECIGRNEDLARDLYYLIIYDGDKVMKCFDNITDVLYQLGQKEKIDTYLINLIHKINKAYAQCTDLIKEHEGYITKIHN